MLTVVVQLQDADVWATSFLQTVLDRSKNTLTEIEIGGRCVQSMNGTSSLWASKRLICAIGGEVPLSLKSFPCLRKLSLVIYFSDDLYWEPGQMSRNDLQGAVTLLSSKTSTTTLNHLRFNCDPLLSPRNRKSLLRENSVVRELETILQRNPIPPESLSRLKFLNRSRRTRLGT